MKLAKQRYDGCENKKPKSQIEKEMDLCKKYWRCNPFHYTFYDLYKDDYDLTDRQLINYIPSFFWYDLFHRYYIPTKESILIDNKLITEQIFRSNEISQPETLIKLIDGHFFSENMQRIQFNDIQRKITESSWNKIFVKPAVGLGAYGTYVFKINEDGFFTTTDNITFNEAFLKGIGTRNDYIVQPGVEQHQKMSEIYPHALNTHRVITEYKDDSAEVLCAFLRIGRGGADVDNASQTGIMTGIDINTGKLNDVALSFYNRECYKNHPDTGYSFKNYDTAQWDEIKNFAIESAKKFPKFKHLGWDIGLSKNGPIAIETNLNFSIDSTQIVLGGLREVFRIDQPDYYWRNLNRSPNNENL
ncbi:sugar-transfer associated ATP-grasp domain-containing protein [Methanocalculus sp.]|uniref:sugar-transfer associated ATP-grasp domain-containing protein n=1 Tax=Methanocalculus sp. TaxID=2004547 RepID=UPI00260429B5|nr:sugar-transfer associated ATP-grasp domain-containing protein [Methanocalculus sp.]